MGSVGGSFNPFSGTGRGGYSVTNSATGQRTGGVGQSSGPSGGQWAGTIMGGDPGSAGEIVRGRDWGAWQNLLSPGQYDMAGGLGYGLDSDEGMAISFIGDPLDVFGERAGYYQDVANQLGRDAAERSVNALREQYYATQEMNRPFLEYGQEALRNFGQYEQGPYFEQQLGEGRNALMGSAAAAGLSNSSYNANRLADFVNQLTGEDVQNQYMQDINAVRIGQGASGTIGGAGQAFGQGASQAYQNQGNLASMAAQNYGQNRANMYNNLAQVMQGASQYFGSR